MPEVQFSLAASFAASPLVGQSFEVPQADDTGQASVAQLSQYSTALSTMFGGQLGFRLKSFQFYLGLNFGWMATRGEITYEDLVGYIDEEIPNEKTSRPISNEIWLHAFNPTFCGGLRYTLGGEKGWVGLGGALCFDFYYTKAEILGPLPGGLVSHLELIHPGGSGAFSVFFKPSERIRIPLSVEVKGYANQEVKGKAGEIVVSNPPSGPFLKAGIEVAF